MGRGDKRSRKGKINAGSYGNSRPKPRTPEYVEGVSKPQAKAKPAAAKKAAPKKAAAKKPAAKKAAAKKED